MQSVYIQRIMKKIAAMGPKKQTQNKANFLKKPFSSMLICAILPSLKNMHFPDKVSIKNSRKQGNNSLKLSEKGRKITKMPYKSNLVRR